MPTSLVPMSLTFPAPTGVTTWLRYISSVSSQPRLYWSELISSKPSVATTVTVTWSPQLALAGPLIVRMRGAIAPKVISMSSLTGVQGPVVVSVKVMGLEFPDGGMYVALSVLALGIKFPPAPPSLQVPPVAAPPTMPASWTLPSTQVIWSGPASAVGPMVTVKLAVPVLPQAFLTVNTAL
ncbi:MAG: hypothetical protein EPGJADBJ_02698 [Saprospiraceae bacterium]|nr:hypothetical protein [Saprospiraceae bacterium]